MKAYYYEKWGNSKPEEVDIVQWGIGNFGEKAVISDSSGNKKTVDMCQLTIKFNEVNN